MILYYKVHFRLKVYQIFLINVTIHTFNSIQRVAYRPLELLSVKNHTINFPSNNFKTFPLKGKFCIPFVLQGKYICKN